MNERKIRIKRLRQEREQLKEKYPYLYNKILKILSIHDPIGICNEPDERASLEYEREVGTILPRLQSVNSAADIQTIIYEEFVQWFGTSSGKIEDYQKISEEIWVLLTDITQSRAIATGS